MTYHVELELPSSLNDLPSITQIIFFIHLSDHQLIVAKLASHRSKQNVRYQCRNLKAVDPISFERELRNSSLFSCPESTVNGLTEQLQRVVIMVLDVLAPVRCRLRRPPNQSSKWLSTEAVAAKRERRHLERRWLTSKNESDCQRHRRTAVQPTR